MLTLFLAAIIELFSCFYTSVSKKILSLYEIQNCQTLLASSSFRPYERMFFQWLRRSSLVKLAFPRIWFVICLLSFSLTASAGGSSERPFIVFLVAAAHLDYEESTRLLTQLQNSNWLSPVFMGHSWVYLEGQEGSRREIYENGVTLRDTKSGVEQFINGVLDLARYGYVNPTSAQRDQPRYEPNPISYLWRELPIGYLYSKFEVESRPSFAARVDLTEEQFRRVRTLLDPSLPEYKIFQLTGHQCSSFVAKVAARIGIHIEHQVKIKIPPQMYYQGELIRLWTDPYYSHITLSSPDIIESSLRNLVAKGLAVEALNWYLNSKNSFWLN